MFHRVWEEATWFISNPTDHSLVRIVIGSDSQRSYVTQHRMRRLSLTTEGEQSQTTMTFGSNEELTMVCNFLNLVNNYFQFPWSVSLTTLTEVEMVLNIHPLTIVAAEDLEESHTWLLAKELCLVVWTPVKTRVSSRQMTLPGDPIISALVQTTFGRDRWRSMYLGFCQEAISKERDAVEDVASQPPVDHNITYGNLNLQPTPDDNTNRYRQPYGSGPQIRRIW